jgi:hypothetical protein
MFVLDEFHVNSIKVFSGLPRSYSKLHVALHVLNAALSDGNIKMSPLVSPPNVNFFDHLQNVITNKDYALTVLHSSQITNHSTHKVFSLCYVFASRCLVKVSNNVLCLHTHVLTCWRNCPAYNISAWTVQKTPFLCCCFKLLPVKCACLLSRYSVTAVV